MVKHSTCLCPSWWWIRCSRPPEADAEIITKAGPDSTLLSARPSYDRKLSMMYRLFELCARRIEISACASGQMTMESTRILIFVSARPSQYVRNGSSKRSARSSIDAVQLRRLSVRMKCDECRFESFEK